MSTNLDKGDARKAPFDESQLEIASARAAEAPISGRKRIESAIDVAFRNPVIGPLAALIVAVIVFSIFTSTFASVDNFSLILQQSVVVGTLALGQTVIILTGGIDLANGAIMVLGTLVMAKLAGGGTAQVLALLAGLVVCGALGLVSGTIVARLKLPPFIVTLGLLTILQALSRLYTKQTILVDSGPLTFLSKGTFLFGQFQITLGVVVVLISVAVLHYSLTRTAWGRHVYTVGNNPESAKRTGISVNRVLLSVYLLAGLLYALGAWQAFGRSPATSPNGFPTANLDTITAVVIGGTSLFGGRGTVLGSYIGALIVLVLQSGLTQAGIDPLYQNIVTGILVIAAVALDQITRGRNR